MSDELKMGPAGIRGIYERALTPEVVEQLAHVYADVTGAHKVLLGSDTRISREPLTKALVSGLRKAGCHIVELGIVPTPTIAHAVRKEAADGGVMLTASHNPEEYNGVKFFSSQGIFISPIIMEQIIDRYTYQSLPEYDKTEESIHTTFDAADEVHVNDVLRAIDVEAIQNAEFRIAMDTSSGAGVAPTKYLFAQLEVDPVYINDNQDGTFNRTPEPTPDSLTELGETVKNHTAQIGFAQDPDADRLVVVDEYGKVLDENYTLALALKRFFIRNEKPITQRIVVNMSTSRMIDDIAAEYGYEVLRTKVGEVFVAEELVEEDAAFGGEPNGGVIWPRVGYVRDSFAAMGLILEYLETSGKTVSQLVDELPYYESVKIKKKIEDDSSVEKILEAVREEYAQYPQEHTDGVRIEFENGWLQVRPSNTEPLIRVVAEAASKEEAQKWVDRVSELIEKQ